MDPQERREMVAKLIANRNELLGITDTHDDAWFAQRSNEGDRTRKGMLKHLAEAEHLYIRRSFLFTTMRVLSKASANMGVR